MTHVEIGYALAHRDELLTCLASLPDAPDCDLSDGLALLARKGSLGAVALHGPYHSVSDSDRLGATRSYLQRKPLLLLDRDGTINKRMPVGEYVTSWDQFVFIPETVAALVDLAARGFHFAVLTNQAGVARGMIEPDELDRIHKLMVEELAGLGVPVDAVYVCTDHWLDGSYRRKPEPGMLFEASSEAGTALEMLVYVGDDSRDLEAATRAGCGFVYVSDTPEKIEFPKSRQWRVAVNKLTQAVEPICAFYGLEAPR
jgi:D-glycero-D-manno-heptose 1,7-bisphosphate phosphatase